MGSSLRSLYQAIEKVKLNIIWMSLNYDNIGNLLKKYVQNNTQWPNSSVNFYEFMDKIIHLK